VLRWGAVLVLGLAHGGHDALHGDPLLTAMLPTAGFVVQVALLSYGQTLAGRRGWSLASKAFAVVLVTFLGGTLTVALHVTRSESTAAMLAASASAGLGVSAFWLLVFYFPAQLGQARTRALAAENERRKAELARLRANLHPHFLLNTLNAVAGLLVAQPKLARQLLVALGDLLRDSLEEEGESRSLAEETRWLKRYAEILEIRHAGALCFEWDMAPDSLSLELPRLLVQPLLENAVKHGALRRPGGGTVTVRSRAAPLAVEIVVSDDGPGMSPDRPAGLGLRLVEDRLRLAHPDATLSIDTSSAGTSVTLRVPKTKQKTEQA